MISIERGPPALYRVTSCVGRINLSNSLTRPYLYKLCVRVLFQLQFLESRMYIQHKEYTGKQAHPNMYSSKQYNMKCR